MAWSIDLERDHLLCGYKHQEFDWQITAWDIVRITRSYHHIAPSQAFMIVRQLQRMLCVASLGGCLCYVLAPSIRPPQPCAIPNTIPVSTTLSSIFGNHLRLFNAITNRIYLAFPAPIGLPCSRPYLDGSPFLPHMHSCCDSPQDSGSQALEVNATNRLW